MTDTPKSATFGLTEMQAFAERHDDPRVRAIWRRLVEVKSKNARWCEAAAAAEKEASRLRLSDAEREALEYYIGTGGPDRVDATLSALLARLGGAL